MSLQIQNLRQPHVDPLPIEHSPISDLDAPHLKMHVFNSNDYLIHDDLGFILPQSFPSLHIFKQFSSLAHSIAKASRFPHPKTCSRRTIFMCLSLPSTSDFPLNPFGLASDLLSVLVGSATFTNLIASLLPLCLSIASLTFANSPWPIVFTISNFVSHSSFPQHDDSINTPSALAEF